MVSLGFKLIIHAKTGECQTVHQYRVSDQGCQPLLPYHDLDHNDDVESNEEDDNTPDLQQI